MPHTPRPGPEPPEFEPSQQGFDDDGLAGEEPGSGNTYDDLAKALEEEIVKVERILAPTSTRETKEEHARRLQADRKIVEVLKKENFEGESFNRLARKMVNYGWPIMTKWLGTGEIFQEALRCRGQITRHPADQDWTLEDRRQLATDTVLEGVEIFRRQLRAGNWNPDKGASLKTYFIGSCVCAFLKVYGLWRREQIFTDGVLNYDYVDDLESTKITLRSRTTDPEENAVLSDLVERTIRLMTDPDLRRIVGLRAIGYTQREAAEETGLTEKAAERRLARFRQKMFQNPPGSGDSDEGER